VLRLQGSSGLAASAIRTMKPHLNREYVRIGAGAGFSGDRIEPALELVVNGQLDYLVFECLAERTIALAQQAKTADSAKGFDPFLEARMRSVLAPCIQRDVRIVTNMGAANPIDAAHRIAELAREAGLSDLIVAAVTGDDVLSSVLAMNPSLLGRKEKVSDLGVGNIVSANAYIGAAPIVEALKLGAQVVVTGRVADPALFLAPLIFEFGWDMSNWPLLGSGTLVGHLLECAGQLTGGYFADPGVKDVPGLARLGFPFADVTADGNATFGKVDGSGGRLDQMTCKEQLLYELGDPARYLTPDVSADFSNTIFHDAGPDRVRVTGGTGRPAPEMLKVSIGYMDGFIGEGQISYAGHNAHKRARLALDIVRERLQSAGDRYREIRFELIGVDTPHCRSSNDDAQVPEVRARAVARTATFADAQCVGMEIEGLYTNGPAGGGGVTRSASPVLAIESTLMPRSVVTTNIDLVIA
jgi:hypothetical protein